MPAAPAPVRIRASAAIVRDGRILLVAFDDPPVGKHYNLPGGGVEMGETIREAARREVREETTAQVTVGPLLLTWEFLNPDPAQPAIMLHSVGFVFAAELAPGSEPTMPPAPDPWQIGVEWLPLAALADAPLLPPIAETLLANLADPPAFDLLTRRVDAGGR